jgi:molecular chaperone DnaK
MKPFIAADLGTSTSAVGIYGPRGPEVIKVDGADTMPSVVMLVPTDDPANPWDVVVGAKAIKARDFDPKSPYCFTSIKRQLGAVYNPEEATPDQMVPAPNGMLHYQGPDGITYAPEELIAHILVHLRKTAEAKIGQTVTSLILCVPTGFNIAQRNALRKAADLAGFDEVELLDEPVAAAIAHGFQIEDDKVYRIFVCDVGAGTTDCAAFEIGAGLFRVLGTNGAELVGGDDWDRNIRSQALNMHQLEHEDSTLATDATVLRLMLTQAELTKRRLSDEEATEFRMLEAGVDKLGEDIHIVQRFSRDLMDEITSELLNDIEDAIDRTMAEARQKDPRFTIRDIDAVICVGGQTRVKAIQKRVAAKFQKQPRSDVDPELAVVLGGAVQAGIREGRLASITVQNITAHSFSIETHDKPQDVATEIVRKGTAFGTRATWWLSNRDRDQGAVTLRLLQGDDKDPAKNILVWEQHIEIDPGDPRSAEIQLDVEIDPSGEPILEVAGYRYGRVG